MVVTPPAIPFTTPVAEPTVAMPGKEELHVPPAVASVSVTVSPWHTEPGLLIANGNGFTVIIIVVLQLPAGKV